MKLTKRDLKKGLRWGIKLALLSILTLVGALPCLAGITKVVVDTKAGEEPVSDGKSYGSIGSYRRIHGLAYGELDPLTPQNMVVQDLRLAPRNRGGRVEYVTTFTLLIPSDMAKWSGVLVYQVVNRGSAIMLNRFESGDAFLSSGWQGDLPFGGKSIYGTPGETIKVPVARNLDGTSVTGSVLARFLNIATGTKSVPMRSAVGYASSGPAPVPVDLETSHAELSTQTFEGVSGFGSIPVKIANGDWSWGDCSTEPFPGKPDPLTLCIRDGFKSSLLYQLSYTAKDPLVLGVGLAAIRDLVDFFERQKTDTQGWMNPLAGHPFKAVIRGESQAGNLLRTFLNLGFNEGESHRAVFDGALSVIAARQTPINFRFAVPGGAGTPQELGSDGTVWWEHWKDDARGLSASGLLDRCRKSHTCPKIMEVLGSSEFWSLRASPDFVGTSDDRDIPLPSEVRRYYIASTQHGGGQGGFHLEPAIVQPASVSTSNPIAGSTCVLPPNPNPMKDIERALLADLEEWITEGKAPPPSTYPTLSSGELVRANARDMDFPGGPQLPSPDGVANPLLVYDLGNTFSYNDLSGVLGVRPSAIKKVIQPLVPKTDADGNEIGGIHTVLQQAALGTYLGWNLTSTGFNKGQYCSLTGSFIPFEKTKVDRERMFDPRLSLEERYGTQRGYLCVAREAARRLQEMRLLLPEDAALLVDQAEHSDVLWPNLQNAASNIGRADQVCRQKDTPR